MTSAPPDETNLPTDIPSYLSSQGTLADRQEGYVPSESGSSHQYMSSSISGFYLPPKDMNGKTPALLFFKPPAVTHFIHVFFFFNPYRFLSTGYRK